MTTSFTNRSHAKEGRVSERQASERQASSAYVDQDARITGAQVLDPNGQPLGKVSDVIFDGPTATPTWLVVKSGIFRAEHFVPVRGSYRTEADRVVVPFDRQHIRAAPRATGDHVVTREKRALLVQHYHLVD